jgi:hypothetical protein
VADRRLKEWSLAGVLGLIWFPPDAILSLMQLPLYQFKLGFWVECGLFLAWIVSLVRYVRQHQSAVKADVGRYRYLFILSLGLIVVLAAVLPRKETQEPTPRPVPAALEKNRKASRTAMPCLPPPAPGSI